MRFDSVEEIPFTITNTGNNNEDVLFEWALNTPNHTLIANGSETITVSAVTTQTTIVPWSSCYRGNIVLDVKASVGGEVFWDDYNIIAGPLSPSR